jgi:hypothetical protein
MSNRSPHAAAYAVLAFLLLMAVTIACGVVFGILLLRGGV